MPTDAPLPEECTGANECCREDDCVGLTQEAAAGNCCLEDTSCCGVDDGYTCCTAEQSCENDGTVDARCFKQLVCENECNDLVGLDVSERAGNCCPTGTECCAAIEGEAGSSTCCTNGDVCSLDVVT